MGIVKRTIEMLLCVATFCNLTLFAQVGKRPEIVQTTEKSAIHVPPQEAPTGLTKIYGNLGTKTNLYNDTSGWQVNGPNSLFVNYPNFVALPFTPKSNSHVSQVRAAVGYNMSGQNQVNLSLYSDTNGVPGTLLAGPVTVTNLHISGTCCSISIANFPPVAVNGGSQYWVVADTPLSGTGSDFIGVWNLVAKPVFRVAFNSNEIGWFATDADLLPAGEVLGTVP
jgi:hypothetical protein